MSESYVPVCLTCRTEFQGEFASASGFYRMVTPFRDHEKLAAFEHWLGEHERHDVRILWEQDPVREGIWEELHPELKD